MFYLIQKSILVAERGSTEMYEHGTSDEREKESEVVAHKEPKQADDGKGRRAIVENASYGESICFYGRL